MRAANSLCASLDCEYVCRSSLEGGSCACPDGKKLANDSRSCIGKDIQQSINSFTNEQSINLWGVLDLNECEEWGYCDQKCDNTLGGFRCACVDG